MDAGSHATALADLDRWVRTRFAELNTELEDLYFAQPVRSSVEAGSAAESRKAALVSEGRALIAAIDPDTTIGLDFDTAFTLLGNVGFFMAACRRHEIDPATYGPEPPALALRLGGVVGTVPRFVTAHLETHNRAVDGVYRTFTSLPAEETFITYNTRSAFAYMGAADVLVRIIPLGVTHPETIELLAEAERAIVAAHALNVELGERLDVDRFFFSVRPYYRPHPVGSVEYRGANAGDFAAFNEVDTLLGLCSMSDPSYARLVHEKVPFLVPTDQERLRVSLNRPNLFDRFLAEVRGDWARGCGASAFAATVAAFVRLCEAHGRTAAHHHDELVARFIRDPASTIPSDHLEGLTASGPPLDVLLRSLERLRDLRLAADRDDIPTRHDDLAELRAYVAESVGTPVDTSAERRRA